MKFIASFVTVFCVLLSLPAQAADTPYIPVGQAKSKKTVIAFPSIRLMGSGGPLTAYAKKVETTVVNDLTFMDLFKFLSPAAFLDKTGGLLPTEFKMSDWSSIGTDLLLKTGISVDGANIKLEAYLYDVSRSTALVAKRYIATPQNVEVLGHTLANDIVNGLTGLPGIFLTKIAMSCDLTGKKEIYTMNFDGTEAKQVTSHRSIALAPDWSPDGNKIVYSLYTRHTKNVKNIDLYEYDFKTSKARLLSNRTGINSGASYAPNGKKIALTMSFLGNPEIFTMDLSNQTVSRLTNAAGFDVDPSWSPDGNRLAYVSSKSGKPMVYTVDIDGTNDKRLTFAGRYNATPSWSKQNNKIAFAGWIDSVFDIFIMNPDGTNIERLTKGQGNNEDPHFSPDGNFIVFSSSRAGKKNIYVMNIDGTFTKRLTYGLGNCVAPKWSAPPTS